MQKSLRKDRIRRICAVVAVLGLMTAGVAFFLTDPNRGSGDERAEAAPASSTSRAAGSTASGRSTGSSTSTSPGRSPSDSPDRTSDGSGPGRSAPGVMMVASPRDDGSWDVVEYVRLAKAAPELALSRADITAAGGEFAGLRAEAVDLQASTGDDLATVTGVSAAGDPAGGSVQAAAPATDFVLRYVLDGATVRSVPSKAGRALTALGPIADPGGSDAKVQIVVTGQSVRGIACPLLTGDAQLCEAGSAPRLTIRQPLPRREAIALVQFDLPRPQ